MYAERLIRGHIVLSFLAQGYKERSLSKTCKSDSKTKGRKVLYGGFPLFIFRQRRTPMCPTMVAVLVSKRPPQKWRRHPYIQIYAGIDILFRLFNTSLSYFPSSTAHALFIFFLFFFNKALCGFRCGSNDSNESWLGLVRP